jgi:hypothetical protein
MKTLVLSLALVSSTQALANFRPIPDYERISSLLEGRREIMSLVEIEKLALNQSESELDLWSGSYWPHFQGSLAVRYRDPNFIQLMEKKQQWDKFKELNEKLPLYTYSGRENYLSPAEKYDLLVGDSSMSLTKYSWELGEKAQKFGKVPTWRGICDGWSAASQKMPRPVKAVTLNTPAGKTITFYPEDIKALGSLLYARAQNNVIFLGKRCYSAVLGVFNGSCDGTNTAAYHKALVNRVGAMKKTFIADASTSSEVWNYPVKSYKFTYFNVFNEEESVSFKDAMELFVKKNRFSKPNKRHDSTYAIVGVKAEVIYADMRPAHLLETDSKEQDKDLKQVYYYDLELDRRFNVIGGEWIGSTMPDFIWAPNDVTYPLSNAEENGKPKTAAEILKAAQTSSKAGQPLSMIVKNLFELAKE